MKMVTALRVGKGRQKRVNLFLDGKFVLSLEAEVVAEKKLHVGQELTETQVEALARAERFHCCLRAATRYLSYRLRSESELRGRLRQHGYDRDIVEAAVVRLKEQGLVDDAAFARFWKDNRQAFRPRSQRLTGLELRRKGVSREIIDQVVGDIEDDDSAYRAVLGRARKLNLSDYENFRSRLGGFLRRRGFGYEVIGHTLERVWRERGEGGLE